MGILSKISKKTVVQKESYEAILTIKNDFVIPLNEAIEEKIVLPFNTTLIDEYKYKALKIDEKHRKKMFLCQYFHNQLLSMYVDNDDRIKNMQEFLEVIKLSVPKDCEEEINSITFNNADKYSRFNLVKSDVVLDILYDFCKYVSDNAIAS